MPLLAFYNLRSFALFCTKRHTAEGRTPDTVLRSLVECVASASPKTRSQVNGMSEESKGRIVFLDYMRIFAFISVLIGHKFYDGLLAFVSSPDAIATTKILGTLLNPFLYGGGAGVIVFFLTSGYIITAVLRRESTGTFLINRIFRIYPLYIVAVMAEVFIAQWWFGTPIPSAEIMVPRLLLVGDFFTTPYALAGVEWTLRLEIMFYVFMAILKSAGMLKTETRLALTMLFATVALYIAPTFPHGYGGTDGYFNTYAPFLLIGSLIFAFEKSKEKGQKIICVSAGAAIFWIYLLTLQKLHSHILFSTYGIAALLLFAIAWKFQHLARSSFLSLLLAELTYSIYLFHNWAWGYLGALAWNFHIDFIPADFQIIVLLMLLCYALNKTIEKGGISLGKMLTKRIRISKRTSQPIQDSSSTV